MAEHSKIAIVILAAGESSRMRRLKQLLPWGGTTLLGNAIQVAKDCKADNIYAVLGAQANDIRVHMKENEVDWILNKKWKQGMGTSIACAVNHLVHSKQLFDGILFTLCDQPFITATYLNKIIDTFNISNKGIIATAYESNNGVPVLFDKLYFEELGELNGITGARKIIKDRYDDVESISSKGIEKDLDTFEEYKQALKLFI